MVVLAINLTACGNKEENSSENSEKSGDSSSSSKNGFIEKTDEETLSKIEINVFNKMFKIFEGESKTADDVSQLINKILSSNQANPSKLVSIESNGEKFSDSQDIETLKEQILEEKNYNISFKYNENGMIDTAIITEK